MEENKILKQIIGKLKIAQSSSVYLSKRSVKEFELRAVISQAIVCSTSPDVINFCFSLVTKKTVRSNKLRFWVSNSCITTCIIRSLVCQPTYDPSRLSNNPLFSSIHLLSLVTRFCCSSILKRSRNIFEQRSSGNTLWSSINRILFPLRRLKCYRNAAPLSRCSYSS